MGVVLTRAPDRRVGRHDKKKNAAAGARGKGNFVNERFVYPACVAASLEMYGQTEDWTRYLNSLKRRKLYLPVRVQLSAAQRKRPAPRELKVGAKPKGVAGGEAADDRWFQSHMATKDDARKLVRLSARADPTWSSVLPLARTFMHFWRNDDVEARLGIHGVGVFATKRLLSASEAATWKPLAYGLEDGWTNCKTLCMHVKIGRAETTIWGPFAFFNGACTLHANCAFKFAKPEWKPTWMRDGSPEGLYRAQVIWPTKAVKAGEELFLDYMFAGDVCSMCPQ
jgi:hypothetical protein